MEELESLIQCSKQKANGKKWISTKELKKQQEENFLKELEKKSKQEKDAEKERLMQLEKYLEWNEKKKHFKTNTNFFRDKTTQMENQTFDNCDYKESDVPPMEKTEVKNELKKLREPITLFGETDMQRYMRLCTVMISHHDEEDISVGQQNALLVFMKKNAKQRKRNKFDDDDDEYFEEFECNKKINLGEDLSNKQKEKEKTSLISSLDVAKSTTENKEQNLDKGECVCKWVKKMLKVWEEDLEAKKDSEKNAYQNKMKLAMHRQTRKDLKPLLRKLKQKTLEEDVLEKLYEIVILCENKEYVSAHDKYISLAIGNAAWPMGVTMVGIHERAGRSKIYTSEVAHILNDETTRKYIQMFKRLMSYAQTRYPTDPSKMVLISTNHV